MTSIVYPDSGDRWIDASTTPAQLTPTLQSTLDAEAAVAQFTGENRHGISLRIGSLFAVSASWVCPCSSPGTTPPSGHCL
jgi:hypothetical protein